MSGPRLRALSAATVIVLIGGYALAAFYAPMDADQGYIQKIFYLHVPMAIVALCGFVFAGHLRPLARREPDFVAVAEGLVGAPYLWGGKTSQGVDCSGLVQISLAQAGIAAPRDTDLQQARLGRALDPVADFSNAALPTADLAGLARGDLVFWKGHVGIMTDPQTLLHATAYTMSVIREPLRPARDRILAGKGGPITAIRRLG